MYPLTALIAAAAAAGLSAAGVVWLIMTVNLLRARVAELEQVKRQPAPAATQAWADNLKLDHRAQLLAVAALVKLSARDQLDALQRLSPEMVREVVQDIAPHLFVKEVK